MASNYTYQFEELTKSIQQNEKDLQNVNDQIKKLLSQKLNAANKRSLSFFYEERTRLIAKDDRLQNQREQLIGKKSKRV